MTSIVKRFFLCCILIASCNSLWARDDHKWNFVWVASGMGQFEVSRGTATVTLKGRSISIEMNDEKNVVYHVTGSLRGSLLTATLSIPDSDYFTHSKFEGTYMKKRWSGMAESSGRDSIILTDGWNVIALTKEIH
jgi:hypothetical protein